MNYQPGDVLKDKYRIDERLGSGAMGEVYRAEHIKLHKEVAIKVMHVHVAENEEALARFKREAHAAAKLEHPHICAVTDFDTAEGGDFYLVMEYLHGETLKCRLQREGRLHPASALRIMDDLLSALECAHEYGIVHRDVKPDNIILKSRDGRTDYVKLIDFGIAHTDVTSLSQNIALTKTGQVYGTPQYLSPEQVLGEPVDRRADLYACGCTLFEMLMGNPPFGSRNYLVLLNSHLSLEPPPITVDIPCAVELNLVVQKLLKKDPAERFQSASEVRAILAEIREMLGTTKTSPETSALHRFLVSHDAFQTGGTKSAEMDVVPDTVPIPETPFLPVEPVPQQAPRRTGFVHYAVIGVLLVAIIAMAIAIVQFRRENAELEAALLRLEVRSAQAHMEPRKPVPTSFVIDDAMLKTITEAECRIAGDPEMSADEDMRRAAEECMLRHYSEAKAYFDRLKHRYSHNVHFLSMYLVDAYALGETDEVLSIIGHIFEIDSAAVCDPAVRNIIYALIEDDDVFDKLRMIFKVLKSPRVVNGLAWLILLTPCNQYRLRFERLLECYDSVSDDFDTKWLVKSVKVWRPFKTSGTCDDRQKFVDEFVIEGLNEYCNAPSLDPSQPQSRCSLCYDIWRTKAPAQADSAAPNTPPSDASPSDASPSDAAQ